MTRISAAGNAHAELLAILERTTSLAIRRVHAFDPSYRGSYWTALCVVCGGRRTERQHRGAKR